jgi:acylphosphatase
MAEQALNERRVVYFRGHVQGVGFRYTTARVAAGFEVTGYVQNLADGRVRVVAEGASGEIDRFVAEIRAQLAAYIRDIQSDITPATGDFDDFEIRH